MSGDTEQQAPEDGAIKRTIEESSIVQAPGLDWDAASRKMIEQAHEVPEERGTAQQTLDMLESWTHAYPVSVFPELTEADRAAGGTITRASAAMGRHMIEKALKPAIAAIRAQQAELAAAQAHSRLLDDQLRRTQGYAADMAGEIDALKQRLEQSEKVLGMAKTQMAIARRFLPSHGSFGEEGISAYCLAQNRIDAALAAEPPGGQQERGQ